MWKLEFWTQGSDSWASTVRFHHQIKRHGEGQRKEVYYTLSPSSAILEVQM
jgi:hypothetical protein